MKVQSVLAALCASALLCACGGGTQPPLAAGGISPSEPAAAAPQKIAPEHRHGRLAITIQIPRKRRVHFISPSTKGMTLAFTGASTVNITIGLTPASNPDCSTSGGNVVCSINVSLVRGSYNATIDTYDLAPVGGTIPTAAKELSTAKNMPFTVSKSTTSLSFTLSGIPASFAITGLPNAMFGTAFGSPQPFTVVAKDAGGNTIVGTYENPVTLSDSDSSGATAIATSGSDSPPSGKLLSSSDAATLDYNGAALLSAVIGAASTGASNGSTTFAPVPALTSIGTSSALIGTSATEVLNGHFLAGNTTVTVSGAGVTQSNATVTANRITVDFFVDPSAATGARNVTVATSASAPSAPQTFTISNTGVVVVTNTTDSGAGSLRNAINTAAANDTIVFDTTSMCAGAIPCTITLASALPPITQNQVIDGGYFGRVNVDGASAYRAFWVDSGTVTIANLQIQNVLAKGGNGGTAPTVISGGGGGGAGLGAGLFVNSATANVNVTNDYFVNAAATGGNGGTGQTISASSASGSGGGGLGGNGGAGATSVQAGGSSGGGVTGSGSSGNSGTGVGANGGAGGGGGGGGGGVTGGAGGTGGAAYGGNTAGGAGTGSAGGPSPSGAAGGNGGFGGGGGGAGAGSFGSGSAGSGGFGGGGGGFAFGGTTGGAGGAGGGGGGGNGSGAAGGSLGSVHGGASDGSADGGGGAAAGPAIFVNVGILTTTNSGATANSASGGLSGGGTAGAGTADPTPTFNYSGTVNGSGTTGPIGSALGSAAPSHHRIDRRPRAKRSVLDLGVPGGAKNLNFHRL